LTARPSPGDQIVQADVLYFNDRMVSSNAMDGIELAKWLTLLGAYRQYNCVAFLLESRATASRWPNMDIADVRRCLLMTPRPACRGLAALIQALGAVAHPVLRQWVDATRSGLAEDWHDPDFL
jgi:hypothetical protein